MSKRARVRIDAAGRVVIPDNEAASNLVLRDGVLLLGGSLVGSLPDVDDVRGARTREILGGIEAP